MARLPAAPTSLVRSATSLVTIRSPGRAWSVSVASTGVAERGAPEEDAGGAARRLVHGSDVHPGEHPRQGRLPPGRVAPDLGEHHRGGPDFEPALQRRPQAREHRAVVPVDGDERSRVQDQCAHDPALGNPQLAFGPGEFLGGERAVLRLTNRRALFAHGACVANVRAEPT